MQRFGHRGVGCCKVAKLETDGTNALVKAKRIDGIDSQTFCCSCWKGGVRQIFCACSQKLVLVGRDDSISSTQGHGHDLTAESKLSFDYIYHHEHSNIVSYMILHRFQYYFCNF